ncbi:MAG: arsenate reductase family protein [Kurthia sp.]|nr:arsenate reductase family protein [Candidatus Kurthia equi]
MTVTVYHYPKCTTCRKALAWFKEEEIDVVAKDIVTETPTAEELKAIYTVAGAPLKKFFNTSGLKYRELGLKDRLAEMSEEEQFKLLASDGMLIKRPLTFDGKSATFGFKESEFVENWKND